MGLDEGALVSSASNLFLRREKCKIGKCFGIVFFFIFYQAYHWECSTFEFFSGALKYRG